MNTSVKFSKQQNKLLLAQCNTLLKVCAQRGVETLTVVQSEGDVEHVLWLLNILINFVDDS
jgi:hypothetical protein